MNADFFMSRALKLADSPEDCLLPNPRVGAVIVRDQKIVGEGFHRGPGFPHAEIEAIKNAEKRGVRKFDRCEIYVTLEPCCHLKKRTPPCVPVLIEKKFKRVIVANLDPNPLVSGKGIQELKKAGVSVNVGTLAFEAMKINQDYIKNQQTKLPYITLKIATTFDGKMADDFGKSKWITTEESRAEVQKIRARANAIGVGRNTIDRDNPSLNVRLSKKSLQRIIVIFGRPSKPLNRLKVTRKNGSENIHVVETKKGLQKTLRSLFDQGILHLMIEGGSKLASEFLREGLIDQIHLFQGKGFLGGKGRYSIGSHWGLMRLEKSIKFSPENVRLLGSDVLIQGFTHVYRTHSKSR
ncbi:MAG: Riboflavin biosynthesis protein RibD [Bacteriovoracaceae bacterium]|nr:Riboflavin biosynthesis protein RibD [Bacteriovoracaceae bacterium]